MWTKQNNSDTISRQAALDLLHAYFDDMLETDTICPQDLYGEFEALPPVPERRGYWIPMQVSSGRDSWKCSVCGRKARGKLKNLPYCHCGAYMIEEVDE